MVSPFCVLLSASRGSLRNGTESLSKQDALQRFQPLIECIWAGQDAGSCDWAAVVEDMSMKQLRERALVAGGGANVALVLAAERQS